MPEGVGSLLWMLAAVAAILALAYAAAKWAGTLQNGGGGLGRLLRGGGERLSLLARLPVGRSEQLVIVRMQDACLLLGVTAGSITLLKELDAEAAQEWLAAARPSAAAGDRAGNFQKIFQRNLRKRK